MKRPVRVEHFRWLGDKRNQIVYDLDEIADEEIINEVIESEMYLVFSPDTLPEARNRGYRRKAMTKNKPSCVTLCCLFRF